MELTARRGAKVQKGLGGVGQKGEPGTRMALTEPKVKKVLQEQAIKVKRVEPELRLQLEQTHQVQFNNNGPS